MSSAIDRSVVLVINSFDDISLFPDPGIGIDRVSRRQVFQVGLE